MATRPPTIIVHAFCDYLICLHVLILPVATSIPEDILATVLWRMGNKWRHLDPIKVATPLYHAGIITYDEHYHLNNKSIPPGERINTLVIGVLLRKAGDQRNLMVTFHRCLLEAEYLDLAREAQQRGIYTIQPQ